MTLRDFVHRRLEELDQRVKKESAQTAVEPDADAIHDLRVSIRRHTQALRAMQSVLPKREVKSKRQALRQTMDLTAEVRNRDIALELLEAAGADSESGLVRKLQSQRNKASKQLIRALKRKR
jgi:CHAD domain-containing protein